jgi:HEAT repeat protein
VRINAVHCLGELATVDQAPAFLPLLEDEDDDVRQEANAALEHITGERVSPEYIYTPEEGKRVRQEWEELLEIS